VAQALQLLLCLNNSFLGAIFKCEIWGKSCNTSYGITCVITPLCDLVIFFLDNSSQILPNQNACAALS
jgi:hypothetical protein